MKPKRAYKPGKMDNCQTPPYALDPMLPYVLGKGFIWECAAGEGQLARYIATQQSVNSTDIKQGYDFLTHDLPFYAWDLIVTNPPYSLKYKWIDRCYDLGKPFALLIPVECIAAKGILKHFGNYELMFLSDRVNFKMPDKGYLGKAQFPVLWFCHNILPEKIMLGDITQAKKDFEKQLKQQELIDSGHFTTKH